MAQGSSDINPRGPVRGRRCAGACQNVSRQRKLARVSEMAKSVLGVIPARMESKRLPGKPLRIIAGHPMLAWVYHRARQARAIERIIVATDSEEIRACCSRERIPVRMTSREHRSGTDRLIEVMRSEPAGVYVNIQGDEPLVTGAHLAELLGALAASPDSQVATLKIAMSAGEASDPNITKVVTGARGRALYFSRGKIPCDRDETGAARYYKHLGFYAYTAAALQQFSQLAPSPLEICEQLEQLRFLENGVPIVVAEAREDTIGVDTEDDLRRAEQFLLRTHAQLH